MRATTYESISQNIDLLFDYNPQSLSPNKEFAARCPKLVARPSFYDKHIDKSLILKRVVYMPAFTSEISKSPDKVLELLKEKDVHLPISGSEILSTPEIRASKVYRNPVASAKTVAKAYHSTTAAFCEPLASMLTLSPHAPSWGSLLVFNLSPETRWEDENEWNEDYTLQIIDTAGDTGDLVEIQDSMDKDDLETLFVAQQKSPVFAIWDFFPISQEAEEALRDMSRVASSETFAYNKCAVIGFPAHPSPTLSSRPPDAETTSWGVLLTSFCENRTSGVSALPIPALRSRVRPNSRKSKSLALPNSSMKRIEKEGGPDPWPSIKIPGGATKSANSSLAEYLLQRVWSLYLFFHSR
jgi:hypothetical protein